MRGIHLRLYNIFEALHIREAAFIAANIKQNPSNILDGINFEENGNNDKFEKRDKLDISKLKIIDENKIKKITINYKSIPFEFEFYHKEDSVFYHLFTGENKAPGECLVIIINKIQGTCVINNVTTFDRCFPVYSDKNERTGSTLMKIALKLIRGIKDRYKLTKVFLTDNSAKICKNHRIKLYQMLTLLTNTTWYGGYGFVPVDEIYRKQFKKNKEIMDKMLLKDIPKLITYIIKAHKQAKSKENIDEIIKNYQTALDNNALLKKYLKYFLYDYDQSCDIFYYFYEKLYFKLGLYDMGGKEFYLQL
jgi:hypothetical protein